jgi:hypothetical protein
MGTGRWMEGNTIQELFCKRILGKPNTAAN